MNEPITLIPEDVLIATLHRVGPEVRITDDERLSKIFDDAATSDQTELFRQFKAHPQYGYSRKLSEALHTLDHAGSIVRENAAQLYFKVTRHTAGPYGQRVYEKLSVPQQALVNSVAGRIRQEFGAVDGTGKSNVTN